MQRDAAPAPAERARAFLDEVRHSPLGGWRVVVVVAHPDDETIGCGSLLCRLRDVRLVHVTDGAPRNLADAGRHGFAGWQPYAAARRAELEAAMTIAGVPPDRLVGLGIADQRASFELAAIARRLVPHLEGADIVLTHAYEGGHPDHDATAFAVQAACAFCGAGQEPAPVEMPFYHADGQGWAVQRFAGPPTGQEVELDAAARALKQRMLAAHRSQRTTLEPFSTDTERFRPAPPHDFTQLPNAGRLLYEGYDWGMTGERFLALAAAARVELGLESATWP